MIPSPPKTEVIIDSGRQLIRRQAARRPTLLVTRVYRPTIGHGGMADPRTKSTSIFAGWILLLIGVLICLIPVAGLSMMFVSLPICTAAGILGIVGCATGRPFAGVFLIVSSIIAFFVFLILPWLSLLVAGAAAS
jgi:hypothetical protein